MKKLPDLKSIKHAIAESGSEHLILCLDAAPWKIDDAVWFKSHPLRSFRIRRIYPGEWPKLDQLITHSLVRQIEPGLRDRTPINSNINDSGKMLDEMLNDLLEDDVLLMWLWQVSISGVEFISIKSLIERANELKNLRTGGDQ